MISNSNSNAQIKIENIFSNLNFEKKKENLKIIKKSCFSYILWSIVLIIIILIYIIAILYFLKKNSENQISSEIIKNTTNYESINQSYFEEMNTNISTKNQIKLKIKYHINETLVYKRIQTVQTILEINNENKTQDIITTSYILFHIYESYLNNEMTRIFYANLLVLNSTMNDGENNILSGGLNILEDLEKNNSIEESNDNINIDSENGTINEIEFNN